MIWTRGQLLADEALSISILDRTFEHGLGLFETVRTWSGHPTLLRRHLERLARSAEELELPLDPADLPDAAAVAALLAAEPAMTDRVLRITLTGGLSPDGGSRLWMRVMGEPPAPPSPGAWIGYGVIHVDEHDPLTRHKTLNYWYRRLAHQRTVASGHDERLVLTADGRVWEGTRSNLFVVRGGALWTPPLNGPVLPGVMRGVVLEHAAHLGLEVHTQELSLVTLEKADELFLTNGVRGLVPVARVHEREFDAPGPVTRKLSEHVLGHLHAGRDLP
jgi:branched-subunit amino acid aminotransferase/4-amino-4-deoxychorismate lyase